LVWPTREHHRPAWSPAGEPAIVLVRLVGTGAAHGLEHFLLRQNVAAHAPLTAEWTTIHEDRSTAIDWLNSRETDADETRSVLGRQAPVRSVRVAAQPA
jgi:hypothetical protein